MQLLRFLLMLSNATSHDFVCHTVSLAARSHLTFLVFYAGRCLGFRLRTTPHYLHLPVHHLQLSLPTSTTSTMSPPPHYLKTPSSISFTISASSTYPPLPLPRFKFKHWLHTSWPSSTYTCHFNHQDLTFLTSHFNFLWQSSTPVTPHVYIFIQFEYLEPTAQALLKAVSASLFFDHLVLWKSFIQFPSQDNSSSSAPRSNSSCGLRSYLSLA